MAGLQRFFPSKESARIPWCNNYKDKITQHGPTCGESAGAITQAVADMTFYAWLLATWAPAVKQDALEATAYKKLMADGGVPTATAVPPPVATTFPVPPAPPAVPPGILPRLFDQVARIKVSNGFKANPDGIGQDLDILGSADTAEHLFPEFKLKVEQGSACQCARIDFTKFGHQGVWIESRRNGGAWEFLAVDSEKPYID